MLSFELTFIDIVLVIAVGVLTLLFLSQKLPEKPKVSAKNAQEKLSTTHPSTD